MIGYKATASPLSPVDGPVLKPAQKKNLDGSHQPQNHGIKMVAINPKIMGCLLPTVVFFGCRISSGPQGPRSPCPGESSHGVHDARWHLGIIRDLVLCWSKHKQSWTDLIYHPVYLCHSHGKSPFLIGKPSINGPFSMAMLNNQMVSIYLLIRSFYVILSYVILVYLFIDLFVCIYIYVCVCSYVMSYHVISRNVMLCYGMYVSLHIFCVCIYSNPVVDRIWKL
jgi:hypothetical protein